MITRRRLLEAAGATLAAAPLAAAAWKGKPASKLRRWDVVTLGNLSRNRYWGEGDEKGVRPVICSCTLIQGDGFRLLADPSLADAGQMARELDRRTGLKVGDVTAVFVTHEHGDHFAGLSLFPEARWLASPGVAEILNKSGRWPRRVEGVTGRLFDAVEVVGTPGHTDAHHSLRFDCDGLSVIIAGDAVATRDFFRDRRPFYNAVGRGAGEADDGRDGGRGGRDCPRPRQLLPRQSLSRRRAAAT